MISFIYFIIFIPYSDIHFIKKSFSLVGQRERFHGYQDRRQLCIYLNNRIIVKIIFSAVAVVARQEYQLDKH